MADDELFALKNLFNLGCYQQAISESISAHPSSAESAIEAKFFMYRAYIEQGQYRLVLDEVRQDAPPALLAVKTLAAYLSGNQEVAVSQIKELLAQAAGNWQVLLVAATIFCNEKDYKSALQHTHQNTQLDVMSLVTHIYLALHRTELAKKHAAAGGKGGPSGRLAPHATTVAAAPAASAPIGPLPPLRKRAQGRRIPLPPPLALAPAAAGRRHVCPLPPQAPGGDAGS